MNPITCLFCGTPYPETRPGTYTCAKCGATLTITPTSATQTARGAEAKPYYTTAEAAAIMHRHPATIMRKCAAHEIEAVKYGRGYLIPADAIREILATTPAKPRKKRGAPAPEPEPIPDGWQLDTSAIPELDMTAFAPLDTSAIPTEAELIETLKAWHK